jgi:hypothetical protein
MNLFFHFILSTALFNRIGDNRLTIFVSDSGKAAKNTSPFLEKNDA